ncbi:MAG: bifunctional glutamine-synthetase adenylyltransferase/deadenyltransferase, partial [Brachybacterium sp.]|nr:bifunctional glutamine-synthetase adenylyltransferase/deadenyltransferase [Brachybacterium sp.]
DLGLLAFRRLSDTIGSAHWYLGLLRDSGLAAKRLTRVLAAGRYVGEQLEQIPEGVRWLARDMQLRPLARDVLGREFLAVISRVDDAEVARDVLRRTRNRELLRIAMAHLTGIAGPTEVARALTDLAEAVLEAGMLVALHVVARDRNAVGEDAETLDSEPEVDVETALRLREKRSDPARALRIEMAIIAMGSFGAREMGYSSDADVQFVVVDRGAGKAAVEIAAAVATQTQKILNAPTARSDMRVSADLRPEGKVGPLARSLESWTDYYRRDAGTWEKQALLRARPVVASEAVAEQLREQMDRHRYPAGGLPDSARREITRMKARVESERLPRNADPSRHVKLGRGGMTDVEWTAQILALEHGHEVEGLRTSRTLEQLEAAAQADLLPVREVQELTDAWTLGWQIRRGLFLWKGKEGDALPTDRYDLRALALLIDGDDGSASELEERYLRETRRARSIAEDVIFGPQD